MNDQPARRSTIVAMVAIAVLIGLLVAWLRATAPAPVTDTDVTALLPDTPPVTCATLAEAPPRGEVVGLASSGEVLECPFEFDGHTVEYVGEVVGDVLGRDGGSWVLANDDPYALEDGPLTVGGTPRGTNSGLTLWLPDPLDELVDQPGVAHRRGDVVHVTGVVHRADPDDGGGLTIRVSEATLLAEAVEIEVPVHWRQVWAAVGLAVLAVGVLALERRKRA